MNKIFTYSFYILSIGLVFSFFLTWINVTGVLEFQKSGAAIPLSIDKIADLANNDTHNKLQDTGLLNICYLLYLLPLLAIVHIISQFKGRKSWFFQLDYIVALIAVVVTYQIVGLIDEEGPFYLTKGFYLTVIIACIGIFLQLVKKLLTIKYK